MWQQFCISSIAISGNAWFPQFPVTNTRSGTWPSQKRSSNSLVQTWSCTRWPAGATWSRGTDTWTARDRAPASKWTSWLEDSGSCAAPDLGTTSAEHPTRSARGGTSASWPVCLSFRCSSRTWGRWRHHRFRLWLQSKRGWLWVASKRQSCPIRRASRKSR